MESNNNVNRNHANTSAATPPAGWSPLARVRADHVGIGTADFDQTLLWYTEKLGFRIEKQWTVPQLPGTRLAYLELNGSRFEVVGGSRMTSNTTNTASDFAQFYQTAQGYTHLCLSVDDVDAALAEVNRRGVETFVPAADYPVPGVRIGFIKDNNGNLIEFSGPLAEIGLRGE